MLLLPKKSACWSACCCISGDRSRRNCSFGRNRDTPVGKCFPRSLPVFPSMNPHGVGLIESQASTSPLSLLDHDVDIVACPALLPFQKKPSKKPRLIEDAGPLRERDSWSEGAIHSLLDNFAKKFVSLNRGNLRTRDWAEIAQRVSLRNDGKRSRKTSEQCKNKIDNLKKQYKKEMAKKETTASMVKSWAYYNRMDDIFGASPHMTTGIPGGIDAGNCSQPDCGDECNIEDTCEGGSLTPLVESPKLDSKDDSRLDLEDACQSPPFAQIPQIIPVVEISGKRGF